MKRVFRIVNIVFWLAVWVAVIIITDTSDNWFVMLLQAFIPTMLGLFIHIALRPNDPES